MKNGIKVLVKSVIVLVMTVLMVVPALAADSYNAYMGTSQYVYNSDGSTKLATGSVLQVIYASGGVIHAPNPDGSPSGGDTLIDSTSRTVGNIGGAGYFYYPLSGLTNGSTIYVRCWNASSISSATHYGNSATKAVNNPSPPNAPAAWAINSFSTATTKPVSTPTLTVSPSTLSYSGTVGGSNPASQSVSITNTGSGTLSWTAAKTQSWLTLGAASGTAPSTLTVSVNISGLAANTYTDTITITASGATGSPKTVAVTLTVSPSGTATATLSSATPSSGKQGETITSVAIVGSNTHFTSSSTVSFGSGIVSGTVTASDATHLTVSNVVISSTATTGARTVTVTTGSETATGSIFTVNSGTATTVTIDDYEGVAGSASNSCSSYYVFAPSSSANPTATRVTTGPHEGTYSMNTTYPAIADANNAWRGWGGVLIKTLDLSAHDTISFWVKGDGSSNKVKFQVKDSDGTNFAVPDADAATLSGTSWQEFRVTNFRSKMTRVTGTTSGDATLDWSKVVEYQFVFSGTGSSAGISIDYVTALVGTGEATPHITAVTPSTGAEKTTVTLTGYNFQSSGGTINFIGGGVTTAVKSSDTGTLISSWADGQVVLSLPRMAAGTKTISIVRADGVTSDNTVTFEVTATATNSGVSYNYPNPFNPLSGEKTTIVFSPGSASNVAIYIFDMTARQIKKLDWVSTATTQSVEWNGKNTYDEIVGDGVYLYRIVDAGSGKMISKGKILVINK